MELDAPGKTMEALAGCAEYGPSTAFVYTTGRDLDPGLVYCLARTQRMTAARFQEEDLMIAKSFARVLNLGSIGKA